jgi:hypothetical protein
VLADITGNHPFECAWFTSVRPGANGYPVAKAGVLAAAFWIRVGSRFAFQLYASPGGGQPNQCLSASHSNTGSEDWTAALILMAIGKVEFLEGADRLRPTRRASTGAPSEDCPVVGSSST